MNTYRPKSLVEGRKLGLPLGSYVAIPKQKVLSGGVKVIYNKESMLISSRSPHLLSRKFQDKYYIDKFYTLLYYKWDPNVLQLGI